MMIKITHIIKIADFKVDNVPLGHFKFPYNKNYNHFFKNNTLVITLIKLYYEFLFLNPKVHQQIEDVLSNSKDPHITLDYFIFYFFVRKESDYYPNEFCLRYSTKFLKYFQLFFFAYLLNSIITSTVLVLLPQYDMIINQTFNISEEEKAQFKSFKAFIIFKDKKRNIDLCNFLDYDLKNRSNFLFNFINNTLNIIENNKNNTTPNCLGLSSFEVDICEKYLIVKDSDKYKPQKAEYINSRLFISLLIKDAVNSHLFTDRLSTYQYDNYQPLLKQVSTYIKRICLYLRIIHILLQRKLNLPNLDIYFDKYFSNDQNKYKTFLSFDLSLFENKNNHLSKTLSEKTIIFLDTMNFILLSYLFDHNLFDHFKDIKTTV